MIKFCEAKIFNPEFDLALDIELSDIKSSPEQYVGKFVDLSKVHCDYSFIFPFDKICEDLLLTKEDIVFSFIEKEIRSVCREKGIEVIVVSKDILMEKISLFDAICDASRYLILLK